MDQLLLLRFESRKRKRKYISARFTQWLNVSVLPLVITVWKYVEHLKIISNLRSEKMRIMKRKGRFLLRCFSVITSLFIWLQEASGPFSTPPSVHTLFYFAPVWVTFKFFFSSLRLIDLLFKRTEPRFVSFPRCSQFSGRSWVGVDCLGSDIDRLWFIQEAESYISSRTQTRDPKSSIFYTLTPKWTKWM